MKLFRISSASFPVFDGTGAFLRGGRWNSPGRRAIYCAESLACCRLEVLVHIGRTYARPTNHAFVEIEVPEALWQSAVTIARPKKGWDHPTAVDIAQGIGDAWLTSRASLILRVPSVASRGDWVAVINQDHPEFRELRASAPLPLAWDARLFS